MAKRPQDPPDDNDDARHSARAYAQDPPKPEPYEDPIDKQARQAESVDDRIRVIALLLTQGRWTKTKALQYANLWAVAPKTIRHYAAEANRLRKDMGPSLGLKAIVRDLEAQYRAAYELALGQGDAKGAVAATKGLAELRGANAPKHVGKGAEQPAPGAPLPLPPAVAAVAQSPEALRFWALVGKRPTPAQVAQIAAGATAEQVAQAAGLLPRPPGGS